MQTVLGGGLPGKAWDCRHQELSPKLPRKWHEAAEKVLMKTGHLNHYSFLKQTFAEAGKPARSRVGCSHRNRICPRRHDVRSRRRAGEGER